jgi:hypothetical protein
LLGEAKIANDDLVVLKKNIGELDISVHDFVLVQNPEPVHDLH